MSMLVAIAASTPPVPGTAADRALLIGIDDYTGSRVTAVDGWKGQAPTLHGAVNDVRAVRRLLEDGFGVAPGAIRELTDERATTDAILRVIDEWLIDGTVPGDRVFLHFSGHGTQVRDADGDEQDDGLDEALVTADADCLATPTGLVMERCANVLLDDALGERLDRLTGRHVLTLIDACHSGTSTRGLASDTTRGTRLLTLERAVSPDGEMPSLAATRSAMVSTRSPPSTLIDGRAGHVALFAVASGQLAAETGDAEQRVVGLFSDRLVAGLTGRAADANGDAEVSFAELLAYVSAESERFCRAQREHEACRSGGVDPQAEIPPELLAMDVLAFGRAPVDTDLATLSEAEITAALPLGNRANLRVAIRPGPDFREFEPMTLEISADREGLLMVFDRNADGALVQLYPQEGIAREPPRPDGMPLGWVRPGHRVTMPDAYSEQAWPMEEPYGRGTIIAVLAEDFGGVTSLAGSEPASVRAFAPVPRPEAWLGELRQALESMVAGETPDMPPRAARWSIATADYTLTP